DEAIWGGPVRRHGDVAVADAIVPRTSVADDAVDARRDCGILGTGRVEAPIPHHEDVAVCGDGNVRNCAGGLARVVRPPGAAKNSSSGAGRMWTHLNTVPCRSGEPRSVVGV